MSLDHPNVLPECYVDTNLIQYLMHGTVNHQRSCNKVVGTLKRSFSNRFAIGIIDKDKVEVGYLAECDAIVNSEHLCVLKHRVLPHYLITISPAVDGFLLDCAKEQGVSLKDYQLPSDLKEFTKQTKKITANKNPSIRNLIIAIKNNKEIIALGKTLRYLQEAKYESRIDYIKAFYGE